MLPSTSYSPHSPVAGPLFPSPSPSRLQHDAAAKAIRSIRRSLSRSPSKTPRFHLVSTTPKSPLSPPPRSNSTTCIVAVTPFRAPSPLAVPLSPSSKISKFTIRRSLSVRSSSRSRASSGSPRRRALVVSSDQGNSSPQLSSQSDSSQEELFSLRGDENITEPTSLQLDNSIHKDSASPSIFSKPLPKQTEDTFSLPAVSTPRKRAEPLMGIDRDFCGSPAKRRSLHGSGLDSDFQIFDQTQQQQPETVQSMQDVEMTDVLSSKPMATPFPSMAAAVPRRTSSLRRSTLQQRQNERPSVLRNRPNIDSAMEFATPGAAASKNRPRLSLENFIQPLPRDSLFSSQALPNASVHPLSQQRGIHQPHPLSHAMSQSSSSNSNDDHSPFRVEVIAKPNFSKSLPAGALRPTGTPEDSRQASQDFTFTSSYETPQNGKFVRPFPAAFMSTGLISKRNRTLEDLRVGIQGKRPMMPDTPCKRPTSIFPLHHTPFTSKAQGKPKQPRPEFGTPSTPFNPYGATTTPGTFGKGVSIFGAGMPRRGSFVSVDAEEVTMSPSRRLLDSQSDSQNSEFEMPPTPTKRSLGKEGGRVLKAAATSSSSSSSAEKPRQFGEQTSGNSAALPAPPPPPTSAFGPFGKTTSSSTSVSPLSKLSFLKQQTSPRTPSESILPPDPSRLSISGKPQHRPTLSTDSSTSSSGGAVIPATPTSRGYFDQFTTRQNLSVTPVHTNAPLDVDRSLTSRFDKVEIIGTGEFSEVYRVTQAPRSTPDPNQFLSWTHSSARSSPRSFVPDVVYAVKRSRRPYIGPKDRARKLEEVSILEALRGSDHVLQLVDQWEERNHLYIQTEFCEEGSLDLFLAQVGIKARLDDFRTWKILLELAHGLQNIHDHGFIHLDLKPANILITFEGVLKIADFGMATRWPAAAGIEGEGDREYIGPEVLLGQFDKPADIFALGLIMVEIAANVELPDNGTSWQKLRAGDMSDVPSLTWSPESAIFRDESGNPVVETASTDLADFASAPPAAMDESFVDICHDDGDEDTLTTKPASSPAKTPQPAHRHGELALAPAFMLDQGHPLALDGLVRWMISPMPGERPVIAEVLASEGLGWVEERKRAGATVFEGRWGPADEVLRVDGEMMDF